MDLIQLVMAVTALVGVGAILFGSVRRGNRIRQQDPLREMQRDVQQRSVGTAREIAREMELRVYEYGRTVEARIDSHLRVLDQLILDADREISRLEGVLAESRFEWPADRTLSRTEQQRCFALHEAGFTVEEAARCLNTSPAQVQAALDEWRRPDRRAA